VTKLFTHQVQLSPDLERSSATPVQFLPSALLSWRAPIIARDGMPNAGRKVFDDTVIKTQQNLTQPVR
jgi:hypothetical protein